MRKSNKSSRKKKDKRLFIILIVIFTEILGFDMLLPVLPYLGLSLGLNNLEISIVLSLFSICQLFSAPIIGKLSDRYGRRPLLLTSQLATFAGFLLLAFASTVWILILARVVDGLLGSNLTVTQAYISDISEPEDRTRNYGYSTAVYGAALIFGPLIGGILSTISYSTPMFLAAGICLISIILIIFYLPESLDDRTENLKFRLEDIIPIRDAKHFFKEPIIRGIIVIFFIYNIGFFLFYYTFALFAEKQICIGPLEIGFLTAWIGVFRIFFQSVLITPIEKKIGENPALKIGVLTMILSMVILIFTTTYWVVYIAFLFLAYGTGVNQPILTSKLSKSVEKEETGSVMGVNNSLGSMTQIIAPIVGGAILLYLPSQNLPLSSVLIFSCIFLLWRWGIANPSKSDEKLIKINNL
ncbi:MAG: MFS transporter [Promethearchaeota archaeon]